MKKFLLIAVFLMTSSAFANADDQFVKEPSVSGQFYSADPKELANMVDQFVAQAQVEPAPQKIAIVIAPHAGYVYSGGVAGYSFKAVAGGKYKTMIVIGPSHYFGFEGASVWNKGSFKTPLGLIPVDEKLATELMKNDDGLIFEPQAFDREHSVEVEMPFLQRTFQDFRIVPIVMGNPNLDTCRKLAVALKTVIGNREDVLLVISTDLSHYHPGPIARQMDQNTLSAITQINPKLLWEQVVAGKMELCGFVPVMTALLYAQEQGITDTKLLQYAHSGDVTGDVSRVVGYSSVAFYKNGVSAKSSSGTAEAADETTPLSSEQKKKLLRIARESIETFVRSAQVPGIKEPDPRLLQEEGAFVTIRKNGQLRGCIGNILGSGPLTLTVRNMAVAAASQDPRFSPVSVDELKDIEVEVSVLSTPRRASAEEIQLGKHGVIIGKGNLSRGVFLPQVATETGWSKEELLSELCSQKAGLPPDCWKDPATAIEIFTADVFSEKDVDDL